MFYFSGKCRGVGPFHLSNSLELHKLYSSAFNTAAVSHELNNDDKIIKSDSAADVVFLYFVLNEREPR